MPKLLSANETVLQIPAFVKNGVPQIIGTTGAFTSMFNPTKAILDSWIARTAQPVATEAFVGGNISGAIRDDMVLGLTGSTRSSSRSLTSTGRGEKLTSLNFQANLTIFRDADPDANGVFNLARYTNRVQAVPFVLAHRLGRRSTAASVLGEDWSYYFVETGQPVPGYENEGDQTIGLTFVPKNLAHVNQALA